MNARITCIARKTIHALNVYGQWVAVSKGFMYARDVDTTKVICPTVKSDDDTNNR